MSESSGDGGQRVMTTGRDTRQARPPTGGPHYAEELRIAIDQGEGADKVAGVDPAAAPLGTDAEAGGTPPTTAEVRTSLRSETRRAPDAGGAPQAWRWLAAVVVAGLAGILVLILV